jgi:hypothetical protein
LLVSWCSKNRVHVFVGSSQLALLPVYIRYKVVNGMKGEYIMHRCCLFPSSPCVQY